MGVRGGPSLENRVTTILRALISSDSPSFKILPKKLACVALGQPDRARDRHGQVKPLSATIGGWHRNIEAAASRQKT